MQIQTKTGLFRLFDFCSVSVRKIHNKTVSDLILNILNTIIYNGLTDSQTVEL